MILSKKQKLILAILATESLENLCSDLDYNDYINSKLIKLRCEFRRQLSLITGESIYDVD